MEMLLLMLLLLLLLLLVLLVLLVALILGSPWLGTQWMYWRAGPGLYWIMWYWHW